MGSFINFLDKIRLFRENLLGKKLLRLVTIQTVWKNILDMHT